MSVPFLNYDTSPKADSGGHASRTAIAQAAQQTGVDFRYLLGQAKLESQLDPSARAKTSSATGLFQFIDSTWLSTVRRHGASLGLAALSNAAGSDPAARRQLLDLRYDPEISSLMAGALANDNRLALSAALGREPDASELYLAHFLGADGASRFLTVLASDPTRSASSVLPTAAAANRPVFFGADGNPRSVAGVMDFVRTRMTNAMQDNGASAASPSTPFAALSSYGAYSAAPRITETAAPVARPSMASTISHQFGFSENRGNVPTHVRNAYARLEAFGL